MVYWPLKYRPSRPCSGRRARAAWIVDPVINRTAIRAARALHHHQGRDGLYFSGQYTTGFDAQESAVYSAMKVAESLAPASHPLRSLRARLRASGLAGVSYDL